MSGLSASQERGNAEYTFHILVSPESGTAASQTMPQTDVNLAEEQATENRVDLI